MKIILQSLQKNQYWNSVKYGILRTKWNEIHSK